MDIQKIKAVNPQGVLAVRVKGLRNLPSEKNLLKQFFNKEAPDAYVKIKFGNIEFQTETVDHNANPDFKELWYY